MSQPHPQITPYWQQSVLSKDRAGVRVKLHMSKDSSFEKHCTAVYVSQSCDQPGYLARHTQIGAISPTHAKCDQNNVKQLKQGVQVYKVKEVVKKKKIKVSLNGSQHILIWSWLNLVLQFPCRCQLTSLLRLSCFKISTSSNTLG